MKPRAKIKPSSFNCLWQAFCPREDKGGINNTEYLITHSIQENKYFKNVMEFHCEL